MLVSVIIPCYNSEKYLQETLDSVFNQTYSHIEIVCVDNGSTDNTVELIKRNLKSHKNLLYFSEPRKGASKARNLGLKKSSGKYVTFLDSDDLISPLKIESQLNFAIKSNLDVVISDRIIKDEFLEKTIDKITFEEIEKNPLGCAINSIIITGNPLYKKDVVSRVGGYSAELKVGQDWDFHIKLFLTNPKIGYLKGSFLISRQLNNSLSSNWFEVSISSCKILAMYKNELLEKKLSEQKKVYFKVIHVYYFTALLTRDRKLRDFCISEMKSWSTTYKPYLALRGYNRLTSYLFGVRFSIFFQRLFNTKTSIFMN